MHNFLFVLKKDNKTQSSQDGNVIKENNNPWLGFKEPRNCGSVYSVGLWIYISQTTHIANLKPGMEAKLHSAHI